MLNALIFIALAGVGLIVVLLGLIIILWLREAFRWIK
nr:MAG TPA: Mid2 like cell wall stress sensor [Bacteriophage sp.]